MVCFAVGLALAVFPGPAIPFFLIAGGLLALESRPLARLMDWVEVQVRYVWRWALRRWIRLPGIARAFVLVAGGCLSATSAYVAYRLLRG